MRIWDVQDLYDRGAEGRKEGCRAHYSQKWQTYDSFKHLSEILHCNPVLVLDWMCVCQSKVCLYR